MRIGIYNHQHLRGGCPGCSQVYVRGMIADANQCKNKATRIYGEGHEFYNFTDLGDYPADNLNRPGYIRMMEEVEAGNLDVIVVVKLSKISDSIDLVLQTYKKCKEHHVELITYSDGKKVMEILDEALEKWEKKQSI